MPHFEILEHTADVGVRAFGETLGELFGNAAMGLQSLALDPSAVEPRDSYTIAATGEDLESLLVNWLNEIVYFLDGKRVALQRIQVDTVTPSLVEAHAWGEPRDPQRHPARLVVKAATWHQLSIGVKEGRWCAEVYLDI